MRLKATGNLLELEDGERLTSGSVNWNEAVFEFDAAWDGTARTAVFRTLYGGPKAVLLGAENICKVPWEVLDCATDGLTVSVFGVLGDVTVITTNYVKLGPVIKGADRDAVVGEDPEPTLYEQLLAQMQANQEHERLVGRDAPDQHPIWAITGLADELETIPDPMTADELRKILNGGYTNG